MLSDYFFVSSGFMGLIVFGILILNFKNNKMLNIYLVALIFFISIKYIFLGIQFKFNALNIIYEILSSLYLFIIFIPFVHLYLIRILNDDKYFTRNDLKHFVIPVFIVICLSFEQPSIYYNTFFYPIILTIIVFYLYQTYYLLKNEVWNNKSDFRLVNDHKKILKEWFTLIYVLNILISIRLIFILFVNYKNQDHIIANPFQIISVILFDIALVKILSSPLILYGYKSKNKNSNNIKNLEFQLNDLWLNKINKKIINYQDLILNEKISNDIIPYCYEIENLFLSSKILRNPKITLDEISKKIQIPKSHITFIFKYYCKVNYTEFKKIVRVYDSFTLIENGFLKTNTLEYLSITVGFTSYNPFYITFKKISGITPQMYSNNYM